MYDVDWGSDIDVSSDVGTDYESDTNSESGFEELTSVDDTNYESFDEMSEDVVVDEVADIETIIENTNDVEQLYELRDMLVENEGLCADDLEVLEDIEESELEAVKEGTMEADWDQLTLEELDDIEVTDVEENISETDWDQLTLNELDEEVPFSEPELSITEREVQDLIENESDAGSLKGLREAILSGDIVVETEETEEDEPKVLTREITPEILESRERDTEETLDNYRENLREYGVDEEQIEEFIVQEREKINAEYESLDQGDTSSNIYYQPSDWQEIANSLTSEQTESTMEDIANEFVEQSEVEDVNSELQEMNINYDEIYEDIEREVLEDSFADIQIDTEPERLNESLENFCESTWEDMSLDEQKVSMETLADYVVDAIGFRNPPDMEYYYNEQEGDYGGYDPVTNTLRVNEYMMYNSEEAADTIAHELWHAHQHECAINPQSARDYQYQYNFDNYIRPELGQEAYEEQLVEAEARAFAEQFKDRLSLIKGRSI